jgi:hypothetical protein
VRRDGELSIKEAGERLEAHEDTIRAWAQAAVARERSKLAGAVRRDLGGRYWISKKRVEELRDQAERGLAEYA